MSAIIRACTVQDNIKNTGVDCEKMMKASAMFFAVPKSFSMNDTDLEDPVTFFKNKIHAARGSRIYPLFGKAAPIRSITNNKEADVIATQDDGSQQFVRYGFYNRIFGCTSGGLCYAQALKSLLDSGYDFLEIDNADQMLAHLEDDGTYSGVIADNMFAPSPDLADLKNPAKTLFQISVSPDEYIGRGVILTGASQLLDLNGLIDATIASAASASTTKLKVSITAECSKEDLLESLGTAWEDVTNFVVKDSLGAAVTITDASIVNGVMELTGTFTSAATYTVTGAAPSVLLGNDIEGYEITNTVSITIP